MEPGVVVAGMDLDCGSGGGGPGREWAGRGVGFLQKMMSAPRQTISQPTCRPSIAEFARGSQAPRLPRSQGEPRSSLNGSQTLIDNSQLSLHERVCNAPAVSWERANRCPTPTGNGRQCHI